MMQATPRSASPSAAQVGTYSESLSVPLTDEHLDTLSSQGYCIVESFIRPEVVADTVAQLHQHIPTWEQFHNEPESWPEAKPLIWQQFPYRSSLMNDLALNPELIAFARRALGTDDVMLSHSEAMTKYASDEDFDQRMHLDFPNNTFVVPMADDREQLASISYLTDVTIDLGPTRVVSTVDGEPYAHRANWTRDEAPDLYRRERAVTVPAGSIFLYSMRTFHRGSAFTATRGLRHSIHIAYQRRSMTWGGWRNFIREGHRPALGRLVTRLTSDQRTMLGFPPPGDPYWTAESIAAVQDRYPDMDVSDYRV